MFVAEPSAARPERPAGEPCFLLARFESKSCVVNPYLWCLQASRVLIFSPQYKPEFYSDPTFFCSQPVNSLQDVRSEPRVLHQKVLGFNSKGASTEGREDTPHKDCPATCGWGSNQVFVLRPWSCVRETVQAASPYLAVIPFPARSLDAPVARPEPSVTPLLQGKPGRVCPAALCSVLWQPLNFMHALNYRIGENRCLILLYATKTPQNLTVSIVFDPYRPSKFPYFEFFNAIAYPLHTYLSDPIICVIRDIPFFKGVSLFIFFGDSNI
jgi:hypothetical protein